MKSKKLQDFKGAVKVPLTFRKRKDGSEVWKLGGVEGDSFSDTIGTLCEANVTIYLMIVPDMTQIKVDDFPGLDLRYWRGKVLGQAIEKIRGSTL